MKNNETEGALKAIVKSSIFVFIFLSLSKVITYFYRIIIARYFGPEVYGSLSLAIMISGFFIFFSVLGLDEGLLRFIPFYKGKKDNKKISVIFNFSFKFVLSLSIIFGLAMFISSKFIAITFFHNSSLTIFFQIFSIIVPISSITRLYLSTIRSFEEIGWYSFLTNFVEGASKLVFIVIFIFIGFGVFSVSVSYIAGTILMLIGSYLVFQYIINFKSEKDKLESKDIKIELLKYSWPLMVYSVIGSLFGWIDTFAIGFLKTTTDVGIYNAAIPIAALLCFMPNLFMQLFSPMINRHYSENKIDLVRDLTRQIGKWIFIFTLPIVTILVFFPGVIINFLFGAGYSSATRPLIFLAIGYLFYAQFVPSYSILNMIKKSRLNLMNIIISSIINLILNFLLIPKFGINGAAFATMISFIILSLLGGIETNYLVSIIPLKRKMFGIGIIGLVSILLIFVIKELVEVTIMNLILIGILFFLIYFLLIFLTSLDKNDIMILKTIKRRII